MKRHIALLGAILLLACAPFAEALASFADGFVQPEGAENFALSTAPLGLSDGGALASFVTRSGANDGREAVLLCFNADGSTRWKASLGEKLSFVSTMAEQADGTVLLICTQNRGQFRQWRRYALADGALVWQSDTVQVFSDATAAEENLRVSIFPMGERFLREETHNSSSSCEPKYYQLETFEGDILWRVESAQIGLTRMDGQLTLPQGTLLYGMEWQENRCVPTALLMDDYGQVAWQLALDDVPDGFFLAGQPLRDGSVFLFARYTNPIGEEPRRSGNVCLRIDPATGDTLWSHNLPLPDGDSRPRLDSVLELENGILLSSSDYERADSAFLLLNASGEEQAYWTTTFPMRDVHVVSSTLFLWQNEAWAQTTYRWREVVHLALMRVAIPN